MTDFWWLKVKCAQKHMVDINREVARYASHHPYEFTRIPLPDNQREVRYLVRITEQSDPVIAVMLGDFAHNLRSALDHVIVAYIPLHRQRSTSFPILFDGLWATNNHGTFVVKDDKRRGDFETATTGLHQSARALVIQMQPYHPETEAYRSILGIISRLENSDKHRQFLTVAGAIKNVRTDNLIHGVRVPWTETFFCGTQVANDDAIMGYEVPGNLFPGGTVVQSSEVHMEFTGIAEILVKITRGGLGGGTECPSDSHLLLTMLMAIQDVRKVLRHLEPFIR